MKRIKKNFVRILAIVILSSTVVLATTNQSASASVGHYSDSLFVSRVSLYGNNISIEFSNGGGLGFSIYNEIIGYGYNIDSYDMEAVQMLLNHYGYGLVTDGVFGKNTYNDIVNFQSRHGLSADGVCGPNTYRALVSNF